MNFIYLLFLSELFLFIIAFVLSGQDIMAPSVMMCCMFIISTVFAILMVEKWQIKYSVDSAVILITGILSYIVAENVIKYNLIKYRHSFSTNHRIAELTEPESRNSLQIQSWIFPAIIIFEAITLIWYFMGIRRIVGGGLNPILMFGRYRDMTAHIARRADADFELTGVVLNQFVRITKAVGYIVLYYAIDNILNSKIKMSNFIQFVICLLLSITPSIMAGERGSILQFFSAGLVFYYVLWHQKYGWNRNLSWKYIRIGLSCIILGIPIFYFSLSLFGRTTELKIFDYTAKYLGSSIELFDLYVKNPSEPIVFGEESLIGIHRILDQLGVKTYVRDVNLEFRSSGELVHSNIYTFFRRPLHDFGYVGMLIFTAAVASFFAWIYYAKIKGKPRSEKIDSWVLIYGYNFYWIFVSSMLQYSQSYLTIGSIIDLLIITVGYKIITHFKVRLR